MLVELINMFKVFYRLEYVNHILQLQLLTYFYNNSRRTRLKLCVVVVNVYASCSIREFIYLFTYLFKHKTQLK